ncbi:cytochrome b/b6 domain-containing protein [Novosphingobium sp.]|uniref:cytochrome b/b6 domain-containing protein n=1 Tax=Novosphingobium sp. TaxID=1874826 RepID=UPI0038BBD6EC
MTTTLDTRLPPAYPPRRRNWDPVVKLTHWSVVAAILANALATEEGSSAHVWVGYALAAVLALRLLWGLIGPAEARFTAFPPSPRRALAHIRDIGSGKASHHASHNPLGALMVYAIWSCLGVIIATGIAMAGLPNQPREGAELRETVAAASVEREDGEEGEGGKESPLGEVHESAVNLLYLLIVLHIAGVAFETRRNGRDVVLAMVPGNR